MREVLPFLIGSAVGACAVRLFPDARRSVRSLRIAPTRRIIGRVVRWYWQDVALLADHPHGAEIVNARRGSMSLREQAVYVRTNKRHQWNAGRRIAMQHLDQMLSRASAGDVRLVDGHLYSGVNTDCGDPTCEVHGPTSRLLPPAPREPGRDAFSD